jgi:hypothetical protein
LPKIDKTTLLHALLIIIINKKHKNVQIRFREMLLVVLACGFGGVVAFLVNIPLATSILKIEVVASSGARCMATILYSGILALVCMFFSALALLDGWLTSKCVVLSLLTGSVAGWIAAKVLR